MNTLLELIRKPYHLLWSFGMAVLSGFPGRKLTILAVTGTKGKSTTTEYLAAILEAAGKKTAVASTIRFADGNDSRRNMTKMTVPGRGFLQTHLARAVRAGATHAVIELSSEAAKQDRHRFLSLNALVFTNLTPEHIESHGSLERYVAAKLAIGGEVVRSTKRPRAIVANADSPYGKDFLSLPVEQAIPFRGEELGDLSLSSRSVSFTYGGERFTVPMPGLHNAENALAAIKAAEWLGIPLSTCAAGLAEARAAGRGEFIDLGQDFDVVVDYAHTKESLEALYASFPNRRKICVLGNTGGGRDAWKRPVMARVAEEACDTVILTNEDPYDEDPFTIVGQMADAMNRKPEIVMDRREAIARALSLAKTGDAVLISGKGTDPYIMEAGGVRTPWSDSAVAREELARVLR